MFNVVNELVGLYQRKVTFVKEQLDGRCSVSSLVPQVQSYTHINLLTEEDYVVVLSKTRKIMRIIGFKDGLAVNLHFKQIRGSFKRSETLPLEFVTNFWDFYERNIAFVFEPIDGRKSASRVALEVSINCGIDIFKGNDLVVVRSKTGKVLRVIGYKNGVVENFHFRAIRGSFRLAYYPSDDFILLDENNQPTNEDTNEIKYFSLSIQELCCYLKIRHISLQ